MPFKKSFFIIFLSLSLLSGLYAQQPGEMSAYHLETGEEVNLDGRLEEDFWSKVGAATAFRQQEPLEGQLASEQTSVQIAFDDKNLYIGVRLYDREPDQIKAFRKGGTPRWIQMIVLPLSLTLTMTSGLPFILRSTPLV